MLKSILKRDKKRRSKIQAAGIDYECPEIVRSSNSNYIVQHTCLGGWCISVCCMQSFVERNILCGVSRLG